MTARRGRLVAVSAIALLVALAIPAAARSPGHLRGGLKGGSATVVHAPAHVSDEILVRFKDGASPADMVSAHAQVGAQTMRRFGIARNLRLMRLPPGVQVKEAIKAYLQHPDVLYAEPNYIVRTQNAPNDPLFGYLWGLQNTGQFGGTPGADIDAPKAWNITTGSSSVVVAVIDSGIDYNHQDLAANMFRNTPDCNSNGVDDDGNGFFDDCFGIDTRNNDSSPWDDNSHGTHVAGTIGAAGNSGVGVVGVNWNVGLMACKFLSARGSGSTAGAVACLDYVAMMKDRGVNIVATNNSWGGGGFSQALYDAIDAHRQRGILFIAAAGNAASDTDTTPHFPAGYYLPNVVSVAATTHTDSLASFSNFGRRTVHLGAPGEEVLSTTPGDTYDTFSGTSMATPHVTGVAALLKAQDPSRDWRAIKNLILAGGDSNAALTSTITQKRLNAYGALTCSNSTVLSRLQPVRTTINGAVGVPIDLAALHINCANPNGSVTVTVSPGGETVVLQDDGADPDQAAGDGIYSGQWFPGAAGTYTLTFPGGDLVTVQVTSSHYEYAPTTFNYRVITGTNLYFWDESWAKIVSPFPIAFGGGSFSSVFVHDNGYVNFTGPDGPFSNYINRPIPTPQNTTMVAPFWDDLSPDFENGGGDVFWEVTGTSPNRELVIEWRDVWKYPCGYYDGAPTVRFQVVFFEGRSDILFNYADTSLGGYCSYGDRGGAATVGIQTAADLGTQFSFNAQSLNDGTALLWTIPPPGISVTPTSHAFGNVLVGSSADRRFTVRNTGAGTLTGTATASSPFSVVSGGSFSLGKGQFQDVAIRFSPTTRGSVAGGVNFASTAGSVSRAVTGTGTTPAPSLTSLSPSSAPAGGPAFTLTVEGSNFLADSVILWNGVDRPTTFVSSTQLQAAIPASDLSSWCDWCDPPTLSTVAVTVFNPYGGTSHWLWFAILNPSLASLSPSSAPAGGPAFTLTVEGSNFVPDSIVFWNGADRPTTFVSSTQLQAAIPASDLTRADAPGVAQVTVSQGSVVSNALTFTLNGALTLTVAMEGTGSGTVTSSPGGVNCDIYYGDCSEAYAPGTVVTLTATPHMGDFAGWSLPECPGIGSCVVTMDASKSVVATFAGEHSTLTVTKAGHGSGTVTSSPAGIDCGADCSEAYTTDTVVTLTATPASGSIFVGWSGYCQPIATTCLAFMDGTRSVTAAFVVAPPGTELRRIGFGTRDLIYDRFTERLYTSPPLAEAPALAWIDPLTGSSGTWIYLWGEYPSGKLAISDDGQFLYVATYHYSGGGHASAASSGGGVSRIHIPSQTVALWFGLGDSQLWARDLAVLPGSPGSVAVDSYGGIAIFDDGVQRPEVSPDDSATGVIEFSGSASRLYGSNESGFIRMSVDSSGVSVIDVLPGLISMPGADIVFDGGLIYASTGQVIDPEAGTVVGTFPGIPSGALVRPDSTIGRVFFLTGSGPTRTLLAFDQQSLALLGTLEIPNVADGAGSLIRWGRDGLAFRDWQNVYVIRWPLVGDPALTVSRAGSGAGTVTSNPAGIECGIDCSEIYAAGTVVTLTATAAASSDFTGWSGACTGTGACTLTMDAAKSVTASFTLKQFTLTVTRAGTGGGTVTSSPAGIACGADCSETYSAGTVVTLTAMPAAGSAFTGWSGGGCSGTATCVLTMTAATAVTATFTPSFAVTVTTAGPGAGTVTSSPTGIDCGATCTASFVSGTAVTLIATLAPGSVFTGWSGGGCSGTGTCVMTVTAVTAVTATFALQSFSLTVVVGGSAAGAVTSAPPGINCPPTCSASFTSGDTVTLTASAGSAAVFRRWGGASSETSTTCDVTMSGVLSVTATFSQAFSDPTQTAGSTIIKAAHFLELRSAIDTLRVQHGLATYTWTDATLTPGSTTIKRVHVLELRSALDEAYVSARQPPPAYTDPAITAGLAAVKAVHLGDLRNAVRALE